MDAFQVVLFNVACFLLRTVLNTLQHCRRKSFQKSWGGESEVLGVEERSCIAVIIGSNFFLPKLVFGESEVKTNREMKIEN